MKKLLSVLLCLCLLLTALNTMVFAEDEISSFGISMSGFKGGATEADVKFTLSDDRLEVSQVSWAGTMEEDGTFKNQKTYTVFVSVKIKSGINAKYPEDLSVNDLQYSGINKANKAIMQPTLKVVKLAFEVKASETGEYISKAEEEAAKHKHCYCGGYIEIGDHTSHSDVTYRKWDGKEKIQYNSNGEAHIYLETEVVLDSTLNIGGGKKLYLCLNGNTIAMRYQDKRVINVDVGGELRICDCTRSELARITNGGAEYGAGIHNNGTVKMYGGIITKNKGGYGGGVYNNADFTLYGGDIYDNEALYGGGVWNDNDTKYNFIMYEGMIHMNVASSGAGIYNNDHANLTLKGGTMTKNAARYGGALWNNGGNVVFDGGQILENNAECGGGIWNNGEGLLEIKSGNISKNTATTDPYNDPDGRGGGIWNNDNGIINMTGGEITFNKAAAGGGVWCTNGSDFRMSGGVIAENEAYQAGGGIYVQRSDEASVPGKFTISGKAGIVLNYCYGPGGGAYVKGILNFEGEGEITGNLATSEEYIDIAAEPSAVINRNTSMPTQFMDVAPDSYFLEPVKWAVEKKITNGTSDVTFSPDDTCNTAQILTFLWRAAGSPTVTKVFNYADVKESDYFYMAAQWAKTKEMVEHYALYPNYSCNRMMSVYYIWCAAGKPECKTPLKFTDTTNTKYEKYYEAIAWAVEQGITNGTSDTEFSPGKSCTRGQIVTFLHRAAQKGLI
ncbi:MAG: S-layer homology domain-containing protein [Clostridia bacterium]|nr:S-layer homology domain-containing protein [Clostridia bacterium]